MERSTHIFLSSPNDLADSARAAGLDDAGIASPIPLAAQATTPPPGLVTRIDLSPSEIKIHIALACLLEEESRIISHVVPAQLERRGVEPRLFLPPESVGQNGGHLDDSVIKTIARARSWCEDLSAGRVRSFVDIAESEGMSQQYISKSMSIAVVAPGLAERILDDTEPADLSVEDRIKRVDLPIAWGAQHALVGFRAGSACDSGRGPSLRLTPGS